MLINMKESSTKMVNWRLERPLPVLLQVSCLVLFLMTLSFRSNAQAGLTISGIVKDESGSGLPGVNILEKGTTNGTTSDADGGYKIQVSPGATLVYSFIGYKSQEILVGAQTTIDVAMQTDVALLSEVLVVGYGTEKKTDLTGAVTSIKTAELTKTASSDLTQMLQGRVAGVSVTSDGQPGASPAVRIRGLGTFGTAGATTEPLYVVDGVPISGGIRDFNPNDIESMQVLKDASAGAIYGSRAANGVVIITTKRGNKEKPLQIELNSYTGVQNVAKKIPVTNRVGYQLLNNEMRANNPTGPLAPLPGNDPNSPSFINNIDTDWQDVSFKQGVIQDHNLNLSLGSKTSSLSVALDYFKNTGILVGNVPNYERYSARVNSESQKGIVKFGESMYFVHSNENPLYHLFDGFGGVDMNGILTGAPTIPLYDPNRLGGFGGADAVIHNSITLNVPGMNSLVKNETKVDRAFVDLFAEAKLLNKNGTLLTYKINGAYDYTLAKDSRFIPQYDLGYFFTNTNARAANGIREYTTSLIEITLNFEKTIGKHSIKLLAGQTYQHFTIYNLGGTTSGLTEPYQPLLSNGTGTKGIYENMSVTNIFSLLGRLNYSYDDRYLITANIRRDGSSNISSAYRNEIFPSVALAWKIHNEKFFKLPEAFTELKLRASWGQVGNQGIAPYSFQSVINQNIPYSFGNANALGGAVTVLANPALKWEIRTSRNIGIDGSLFNGKLDFTLEYYSNLASDILLAAPIPASTGSLPTGTGGTASIIENAASMQNSGVELSFTYRKQVGAFSFEISPNAYTLKNEVTKLNNDKAFLIGAGSRTQVGQSVGSHYGWVYDGIFQSPGDVSSHAFQSAQTGAGDIRFKDLDGDGVIDDNDRQFLGNALPTVYYGLNITAKYKNFDATIFGSGSGGNLINNSLYRSLMSGNSYNNYSQDLLNNRWTPTNTNTDVPRMVLLDPNNSGRDSNRPGWLEKGDYFRINTLSFGYTLPNQVVKGLYARVYVTGQNLYTFTAYKGFNPDFASGPLNPGFDGGTTGYGSFPKPRTIMVGVQLRF